MYKDRVFLYVYVYMHVHMYKHMCVYTLRAYSCAYRDQGLTEEDIVSKSPVPQAFSLWAISPPWSGF